MIGLFDSLEKWIFKSQDLLINIRAAEVSFQSGEADTEIVQENS